MILLDTNLVSELMRRTPEPAVVAWLDAQEASAVYISVITEAELRYGVAILPEGRRRTRLAAELDKMLEEELGRRVLPFDRAATHSFATIGAVRRAAGMPISHADCQIAAIARSRGARVATRNKGDFEHCGIKVINPWPAPADPDEAPTASLT
ncbi:MAG: type II toxin-antitoxin system VapC family toxin [Spirochaetaceae bacterium]|nr:type II toxin-antitoxin system VapC family toxin [Spirochaetaceae bacterium]